MVNDSSEDEFIASEDGSSQESSLADHPAIPKDSEFAHTQQDIVERIESENGGESITLSETGHRTRQSQGTRLRGYLSKGYRDLLNFMILDASDHARDDHALLASSRLGGSLWTSHEKNALFTALSKQGSANLKALAQHIGTKSEIEVRAYLLLLQDQLYHEYSRPTSKADLSFVEIPAALEVSTECEAELELAAEALALRVEQHEAELARDEFGDDWLIDEDTAERIEAQIEQNRLVDDEEDGSLSPGTSGESVIEQSVEERATRTSVDPAAKHLRPGTFLELSRTLFMNNGDHPEANWHHMESLSDISTGPAMYRSVFDDFYNLTLSLTRRLVSASIFQATSRLRAEDASRRDWEPIPAVRRIDVQTAVDILGMKHDRARYWATAARRNHVTAYSDSKKFADGRMRTKNGRPLTYDEVEAELRLTSEQPPKETASPPPETVSDSDIDEIIHDSDFVTEQSCTDEETHSLVETDNEDARNVKDSVQQDAHKSKHISDPNDFDLAKDIYLDSLDQRASKEEELRLWGILRLEHPRSASLQLTKMPQPPKRRLHYGNMVLTWGEGLEYEADWECHQPPVPHELFQLVDMAGERGRKRRKILFERTRERLESSVPTNHEDDVIDSTSDDVVDGTNVGHGSGDGEETDSPPVSGVSTTEDSDSDGASNRSM